MGVVCDKEGSLAAMKKAYEKGLGGHCQVRGGWGTRSASGRWPANLALRSAVLREEEGTLSLGTKDERVLIGVANKKKERTSGGRF